MLYDAVVHNLQIVGESVRCLPEDARNLASEVEWKKIVGLRHMIVHHYFGLEQEIVWDIAKNKCPDLEVAVEGMIEALAPG